MTWSLRAVRTEVRDQLNTAGLPNVFSYWPQRVNPPMVIIDGGDPYLDELEDKSLQDQTDEYHAKATVRLELTVVAGKGDSEVMRDNLDDLLCKTLVAVQNWNVERVSQPFQLDAGNALFLAVRVTVTATFDLEEV